MSRYTELTTESREPTWFGRMVLPEGGGRPATAALVFALLGLAAFVASITLDWISVTIPTEVHTLEVPAEEQVYGRGLVESATMGLAFLIGGLALITMAGSVLTQPRLALRLRMGVTSLSIGMLALVASAALTMRDLLGQQFGFGGGSFVLDQLPTTYQPGLLCGAAAAVLPAVAVWLAARPADREMRQAAAPAPPAGPPAPKPPAADVVPVQAMGTRTGSVSGMTVSASEPLDLSVNPEAWPRT